MAPLNKIIITKAIDLRGAELAERIKSLKRELFYRKRSAVSNKLSAESIIYTAHERAISALEHSFLLGISC
jgi:hypothetical protein